MQVLRRVNMHVSRRMMNMKIDEFVGRERPKKIWMECVKYDMCKKGVSVEKTPYRKK